MKIINKLKCLGLALAGLMAAPASAQVITWSPLFPTINDSLTVTFDATKGNQGLVNTSPVYVHTGVVTGGPNATGWSLVQGTWGVAADSVLMTPIGNNKHRIKFHIKNYYGITNQTVYRLAFVFRNASGSATGKTDQNGDIFMPIYQAGQFGAALSMPLNNGGSMLVNSGDVVSVKGVASKKAGTTLSLLVNGAQVAQTVDSVINYSLPTATGSAVKKVKLIGTNGTTSVADSFTCVVHKPATIAALPAGAKPNGVTYLSNNSAILSLYAPLKSFVYVLGEFNNWQIDTAYYMNVTPDGKRYWLQINNLNAGQEYAYQYLIDNQLKVADAYSEKILDPYNDQYITSTTYPALKAYPVGKTTGVVSILQTAQTPYTWTSNNFTRPAKTDIVAYELHIRDFVASRRYKTVMDSLPYLQKLGINTIELMPVMEFEGNDSWGYNPMFHMAPDKAYGTKKDLQMLIDECHKRGIAVVLDMVLNHAFGMSPMVQMYWDASQNKPATNSPWFNPDAKHPLNVGYDFNHESTDTKKYVADVLKYWLSEYKVDGFRFDLSKGFTQNYTSDMGAWGNYDQSRINILKAIYDTIQIASPNAYVIMEHFANNSEETVLANYGMMLWGNANYNFNESTMGWLANSGFDWLSYKSRGWQQPNVFGYMESHDEERLMYKNILYGNSTNANHDVKTLNVALSRQELAAVFFLSVPGPKMIWQFGELGYDQSINRCGNGTISENCRTDAKPILWSYLQNANRKKLYDVYGYVNRLRVQEPAFETSNYTLNVGNNVAVKQITLQGTNGNNVLVIGNFDVTAKQVSPSFPVTGKWYDFFSGDSITVNSGYSATYQPAEYHIYSTKKMQKTAAITGIADEVAQSAKGVVVYPNPAEGQVNIAYALNSRQAVRAEIYNALGQKVTTLFDGVQSEGLQTLIWNEAAAMPTGTYFCRLTVAGRTVTQRLVLNQ
ncbi:Por secretion system C-terminal sorting domain-containing protein [Flexibacter flexilis DSM 6793]|uniref:Por secretion system C-terminal sorting domain-containing protein n=1 Tax=Flexibacter flexilis DSM 6793 TaxID=927664 RepID=A0A1I1FQX2_9BACT|nr:alpha-amylase family glycosyl hydrolase [Flexibacter flexilis]SFC01671.1 Por secretion system C-terminal sorting domain-containing protein [Flexibacter flexilis DSM 6793]